MPQSRCLPIAGQPITNYAKNTPLRVDVYGYCLKIVTSAEHDGSGNSATLLLIFSPYGQNTHVPHKGRVWGTPQTRKDTFSEQTNRLSENDSGSNRWFQGITPDLIIDAL